MIELLLKAARPELKDNSIKQYLSSLRTLNGGQPITNVDFLKDYDAVMAKLSSRKPTTIKNYMNSIIVVCCLLCCVLTDWRTCARIRNPNCLST